MRKKNMLLGLLLLPVILTGCASNNQENSSDGADNSDWSEESVQVFAMDTVMSITANGVAAAEAVDEAKSKIYMLENLLSVTDSDSDISAINSTSGQPVAVSNEIRDIITKAVQISDITGGAFNIAMYPILRQWGFTTGNYIIPSEDVVEGLLGNIDYTDISIDGNTVTLPEEMEIDVGGIAKGYAGDAVRGVLLDRGITSAIINLGGDVQLIGSRPDGTAWRVAIQDPMGSGYLGVIDARNSAIMTSGSYERYFTGEDGKTYHHIMDTSTGYPAESNLLSVTIVSDFGYQADALATSLFIMGVDAATEFWRANGGFEVLLVTTDEEIYMTEGLEGSFALSDNYKDLSINIITK